MNLTWGYADQVVEVAEVVQVTLSVSVSFAIEGVANFSFDVVIFRNG